MQPMVGGQTAEGGRLHASYGQSQPIHRLMNQQMTINVSEQGSSDTPDDMNNTADSNEEETQQPTRGGDRSSTERGQRSDGTLPRTRNSGSKRSSTDEGSEPSMRAKRYKEKRGKKQGDGLLIANAGFEIAATMRNETKAFTAQSEEEAACIAKLKEMDLDEDEYAYLLDLIESSSKRKWILMNDQETILRIIRRKLRPHTSRTVPQPSPYAYSGSYQGFDHPMPHGNTSSTQLYPPPNPAANNFYFQRNENNRDGSFM